MSCTSIASSYAGIPSRRNLPSRPYLWERRSQTKRVNALNGQLKILHQHLKMLHRKCHTGTRGISYPGTSGPYSSAGRYPFGSRYRDKTEQQDEKEDYYTKACETDNGCWTHASLAGRHTCC